MTDIDKTMLAAVAQALHGLRFGSLEIVVHEGRIVQLERREKVRLGTEVRPAAPEFRPARLSRNRTSPWGLTGQPEAPVFTETSRW
jgi:hypothetical protein